MGVGAGHAPDAGRARPRAQRSTPGRSGCVLPDVGGAFGSKGPPAPEVAAVAVAALRLGRPVKWAEDRFENFLAAYQGRGVEAEVELALDADGRMLAVRARILADLGAYLYVNTRAPPHTTAMLMCGCYTIPAASVTVVGARTDKVPTGPLPRRRPPGGGGVPRADGRPGGARARARPARAAAPQPRAHVPARDAARLVVRLGRLRALHGPRRRARRAGAVGATRDRIVGTGVALYVERAGGQFEEARVAIEPGGRVIAHSGSGPHGQGHETTFAQIVADGARRRAGRGDDAVRRLRRLAGGRRHVRQPVDDDGRIGAADRRAGGAGTPGRRRDGAARGARALRVRPRVRLRRVRRGGRDRARDRRRCACAGSPPSTMPAGSSTRCSPRAR